jgi:hypothetical protein
MAKGRDSEWAEAKRRCRLSADDVKMAKALGFQPRSLIKNIPYPREGWKAPVRDWVRGLYLKRFGTLIGAEQKPSRQPERPAELPVEHFGEEPWPPTEIDLLGGPERSIDEETADDNRYRAQRHEQFRAAAKYVTAALVRFEEVQKVVLFGSVAAPLRKEPARFRKFARAGIELWHDCKDVDLAVWTSGVGMLKALQKARSRALADLYRDTGIGVAHHQVDIFLMAPGTDRYLGRLCTYGECPKGKPDCHVPGCGAAPFLKQHEDFVLDPGSFAVGKAIVLFDRVAGLGAPAQSGDRIAE